MRGAPAVGAGCCCWPKSCRVVLYVAAGLYPVSVYLAICLYRRFDSTRSDLIPKCVLSVYLCMDVFLIWLRVVWPVYVYVVVCAVVGSGIWSRIEVWIDHGCRHCMQVRVSAPGSSTIGLKPAVRFCSVPCMTRWNKQTIVSELVIAVCVRLLGMYDGSLV
ncbi:hypothetical protein OH77DRAFT_564860 [Trametes cingulata]|nr:hypothetical protein OH77DRAFT_564860 [Trametes cingulata]